MFGRLDVSVFNPFISGAVTVNRPGCYAINVTTALFNS
jgi:hypothetical protein